VDIVVCSSNEELKFGAFGQADFPCIGPEDDVYYAQPYVVGDVLLLVTPIAMKDASRIDSGIYVSVCRRMDGDKLVFEKPWLLLQSDVCDGRTVDLNCAGGFASAQQLLLLIHRDIRERMSASMKRDENRRERFEWWSFQIGDILRISSPRSTHSSGIRIEDCVRAAIER